MSDAARRDNLALTVIYGIIDPPDDSPTADRVERPQDAWVPPDEANIAVPEVAEMPVHAKLHLADTYYFEMPKRTVTAVAHLGKVYTSERALQSVGMSPELAQEIGRAEQLRCFRDNNRSTISVYTGALRKERFVYAIDEIVAAEGSWYFMIDADNAPSERNLLQSKRWADIGGWWVYHWADAMGILFVAALICGMVALIFLS